MDSFFFKTGGLIDLKKFQVRSAFSFKTAALFSKRLMIASWVSGESGHSIPLPCG
jgi:hypothetical protein